MSNIQINDCVYNYTFAAKNHQNKKCVKAIDCETKKFHIIIVCMLFNNILVLMLVL